MGDLDAGGGKLDPRYNPDLESDEEESEPEPEPEREPEPEEEAKPLYLSPVVSIPSRSEGSE